MKKYFETGNETSKQGFDGHKAVKDGVKRPQVVEEDRLHESEELNQQLKNAKKEQARLQTALTTARDANHHRMQDLDLRIVSSLRESLSQKGKLLNELRVHRAELEEKLESLELEFRDCMLSIPENGESMTVETKQIESLLERLNALKERKKEIRTRVNQYRLLKERSLQDRDGAEAKMQCSKKTAEAAEDDLRTVISFFYDSQVDQDKGERLLAEAIAQLDATRTEWQRRTREVRRRVDALQRGKRKEEKEESERKRLEAEMNEMAALERKAALEQQAAKEAEMNNPRVLAQLDKSEALWATLQGASGCIQPQDIIKAYQDLQQRSNALQSLLALAWKKEQDLQESGLPDASPAECCINYASLVDDNTSQGIDTELQRLEKVCAIAALSLTSLRDRLVKILPQELEHLSPRVVRNREGEEATCDYSIVGTCNDLMEEVEAVLQKIFEQKRCDGDFAGTLHSHLTVTQSPRHRRGTLIGSPWWAPINIVDECAVDGHKQDDIAQEDKGNDDGGPLNGDLSAPEVTEVIIQQDEEGEEGDDDLTDHLTGVAVLSIQDR